MDQVTPDYARRHMRYGWWSLLCFLSLGIGLETLHGFKVGLYLDVSNETRRLMWTLAHAHGTLLSLIHIVFGVYLQVRPEWRTGAVRTASGCLVGAALLLPSGFFLGGVVIYDGDPGLGVLLVPIGAVMLLVGVLLAARGSGASLTPAEATAPEPGNPSE